jgi:tetratricopeptide (TPR) repeat protein
MHTSFCPYCNATIDEYSIRCPKCNSKLKTICKKCQKIINTNEGVCPYCGRENYNESITPVYYEDLPRENKTQIYSDTIPIETKTQIYSDSPPIINKKMAKPKRKTNNYPQNSYYTHNKKSSSNKLIVSLFGILFLLLGTLIILAFSMIPNPEKYYDEGVRLYDQENYDEAIASFEKALEINPNHNKSKEYLAYAWVKKGLKSYTQKNYAEAITYYDKAIDINPNYADAWYNKGVSLGRLGRHEEAHVCIEKALTIRDK